MCVPASMVVTRDYVFWSRISERHQDIIRENALVEDVAGRPALVGVEITPAGGDWRLPVEQWKLRVDQDLVPEWWDTALALGRVRAALSEWIAAKLVLPGQVRDTVRNGDVVIASYGEVREVHGGMVHEIRGGTVGVVLGGGTVGKVYSGGTVGRVYDGGAVGAVLGGVVRKVRDGTVGAVLDGGAVGAVLDGGTVGVVYDGGRVGVVRDGTVGVVYDGGRVGVVRDGTVGVVYDGGRVGVVHDGAVGAVLDGGAVREVRGGVVRYRCHGRCTLAGSHAVVIDDTGETAVCHVGTVTPRVVTAGGVP